MIIPSGGSAPRHGSCLAASGSLLVRPVRLGVPGPAAGVPGLELWAKIAAFIATVKLPVPPAPRAPSAGGPRTAPTPRPLAVQSGTVTSRRCRTMQRLWYPPYYLTTIRIMMPVLARAVAY